MDIEKCMPRKRLWRRTVNGNNGQFGHLVEAD